ncbi:MAG: hypothetical protein WD075_14665 [Rhodospirillales bacterium]
MATAGVGFESKDRLNHVISQTSQAPGRFASVCNFKVSSIHLLLGTEQTVKHGNTPFVGRYRPGEGKRVTPMAIRYEHRLQARPVPGTKRRFEAR